MALAEVYKKKRFKTPIGEQLDEFLELANEAYFEIIEVDREIGIEAHKLCREHADFGLMPSDAVHLACAIRAGCDVLLTWDRPLASITHKKIRIEEPTILQAGIFQESHIATQDEIEAYLARKNAEAAARPVAIPNVALRCGGDPASDLHILMLKEKLKGVAVLIGVSDGKESGEETVNVGPADIRGSGTRHTEGEAATQAAPTETKADGEEKHKVTKERSEDRPSAEVKPTPTPPDDGASEVAAKTPSTQPPPSA